jgi:hypothetical protein
MYFISKYAQYGHGIFWIGEDLEEAKTLCDDFCNKDYDDWHTWSVFKFGLKENQEENMPDDGGTYGNDAIHEEVYVAKRVIPGEAPWRY